MENWEIIPTSAKDKSQYANIEQGQKLCIDIENQK